MDANSRGALMGRKPAQRLIGMIMLLCCVVGLFLVSPLFHPSSTAHAAGGLQINAGGPAVAPFIADADFTGGATVTSNKTITTTGVTNPAPQAVYQSNRYGNFSYTIPGLTAGASYMVRLHFAETYWTAAGKRTFNVSINGSQVLTNFDIFAAAGGTAIAVVKEFNATASSTGTVNIQFATVIDNAQVNGIEILGGASVTPTPTSTPGVTPTATGGVPATPASEELHANSDSSITMSWTPSAGATSYRVYRGTAAGGEGNTPIATTTSTSYTDRNLSSTPIYFYQVSAVNAAGESGRTAEDASKTPPPIGTGGNIAGVPSGNSLIFYCKDAILGGFDWFQTLTGWFPQVLGSSAALSPGNRVVDMAYAQHGTMTFNNVVVQKSGLYTVDWRYAFQGGLFPAVKNRQMGLMVNGKVITSTERFPITGSFEIYQDSSLQVQLNAGVNSISMLAVSDHGVSRVDEMTVTPATASVPSGPTNLVATPGSTTVMLNWTASSSGNPTSYTIYRGTASDGENPTPIATVSGTTVTFTDTGLHNGTLYFYNVAANNSVGVSPDTNEVSVTPN
ncbi:MAG: fibronectin type III domain-containing protein [Ktedonobacteraceae bacterium]|nr:fibronectin type III domain-containing protein [Ktedonobacteraceae bacterium]